jgi:hypothetical protein
MFNSTVLEVAIGLVFCYASVALITSSIYEAIASWLNLRSKTLFKGIQSLLNEGEGSNQTLLLGIYNHALASPLGNGAANNIEEIKTKPSYIDSKNFASALIQTVQSASGDFKKLGQDINGIQNDQMKQLLRGMYDNSAGNIEKLQNDLAAWFDSGMDRLSGNYKRQSQLWCFVIALFLAVLFNIDSIHLFTTLWQHPALVEQISSPAGSSEAALAQIQTLPIGWSNNEYLKYLSENPKIFAGWLITASASLFGGPFWFDLLKQLINLRGAGNKPD